MRRLVAVSSLEVRVALLVVAAWHGKRLSTFSLTILSTPRNQTFFSDEAFCFRDSLVPNVCQVHGSVSQCFWDCDPVSPQYSSLVDQQFIFHISVLLCIGSLVKSLNNLWKNINQLTISHPKQRYQKVSRCFRTKHLFRAIVFKLSFSSLNCAKDIDSVSCFSFLQKCKLNCPHLRYSSTQLLPNCYISLGKCVICFIHVKMSEKV